MNDKPRNITTPGFFQGITTQVKLIARLMMDKRISPFLKLLPIGSLIYLVVPTDILPLIPLDDAAVLWAGAYLFVELCPPEIVEEYKRMLNPGPAQNDPAAGGDVIDAEFHDSSEK